MSKKSYPSEEADRYIVRFPEGLRDRIREAADSHGRSMNAEIIARLVGYEDLANRFLASDNAQMAHMWESFAASQKAFSDTMVLNLNNLSRFVLEHSEQVPQHLADAARRHFDFSESYLSTRKKPEPPPHDRALGLPLFPEE